MRELDLTLPGPVRPRRLRRTQAMRDLVAETHIAPSQFIVPRFVLPVEKAAEPIPSLPGISQLGLENLVAETGADLKLGIRAALLFEKKCSYFCQHEVPIIHCWRSVTISMIKYHDEQRAHVFALDTA